MKIDELEQQANNVNNGSNNISSSSSSSTNSKAIQPTAKRYLILFMFFILASVKAFQWICFSSITNIVASHYQVSDLAINWTAVTFMITFLVLGLPVAWLVELIGLRNSILIGTFGTNVGVLIKCFACDRSGYVMALMGHVLVGCVEPFFFSLYSRLAQVWFPDHQVGLATAVGVCGDTLGIAVGFILPSLMVGEQPEDYDRIEAGLFRMFVGIAIVSTLNSLLIILLFDDQPKKAPSYARYKQLQLELIEKTENCAGSSSKLSAAYLKELKSFLADKNFHSIGIAFGISEGVGYALHTLLNQILAGDSRLNYVNPVSVTGIAGSILLLVGLIGSLICGHLLDRFHAYKLIALVVYLSSNLAMVALAACLKLNNTILLYTIISTLGFSLSGYVSCGFDFAVEITYPRCEIISSTFLNMSAQIFGIFITFAGSWIVDAHGGTAGCWFLSGALTIGLLFSCLTKPDYKRQRAIESQKNELTDWQKPAAGIEMKPVHVEHFDSPKGEDLSQEMIR